MTYRNWTCPRCGHANFTAGCFTRTWRGGCTWLFLCRRCFGTVISDAVPLDGARGAWLVLVPDPLLRRAW